jgi:hypothetical protein
MIRRIARAVSQVRGHAVVARELSAGLYEAVASVVRVHSDFEAIIAEHDRQVRSALPGF